MFLDTTIAPRPPPLPEYLKKINKNCFFPRAMRAPAFFGWEACPCPGLCSFIYTPCLAAAIWRNYWPHLVVHAYKFVFFIFSCVRNGQFVAFVGPSCAQVICQPRVLDACFASFRKVRVKNGKAFLCCVEVLLEFFIILVTRPDFKTIPVYLQRSFCQERFD